MDKTHGRSLLYVFIFSTLVLIPDYNYAGDIEKGRAIYETKCILCHGPYGSPIIPGVPAFSKGESLDKETAVLIEAIKEGRSPGPPAPVKPPMKDQLSDADIEDALVYIRGLKK